MSLPSLKTERSAGHHPLDKRSRSLSATEFGSPAVASVHCWRAHLTVESMVLFTAEFEVVRTSSAAAFFSASDPFCARVTAEKAQGQCAMIER